MIKARIPKISIPGFGKTQPKSEEEKIFEEGTKTLLDIIAPAGMEIDQKMLKLGSRFSRTIFILNYPRYLAAGWLTPIINLDKTFDLSVFFHPVDTALTLRNLRKKAAQVEAQIYEMQEKGFVRDPALETAYKDIDALREALQQGTEKMFRVAFYLTFYADSEAELNKIEIEIFNILESQLVYAKPAIFQQFEGFESTMPLGFDRLQINQPFNSSPASTFFPFISVDLTANQGVLYGINAHNNSLIIFDRFSLENANMVIFAKSGAGKSYFSKLEIIRSIMLGADVIVIDPENEYEYLAQAIGGVNFKISLGSPHHINPLEIPPIGEDESHEEVFRAHIANLIGLIKIMLKGITPEEETILDQALHQTYAARDITPTVDFSDLEPPVLEDLVTVLNTMTGGTELAQKLYRYTKGTYAQFLNRPTNVDINKRLTVFNIRDLEPELRTIAMYIILNFIWTKIRKELKKRILLVDEAWWMMQYEDGANFLLGIAKRARKYYLGVTTITQDVDDFLKSPFGKPIINNSSLQLLLKQSPAAIDVIVSTFGLSEGEKSILLGAEVGTGLFFAGLKHVAIQIIASYTEDQIITSDPAQLLAIKKAKQEVAI